MKKTKALIGDAGATFVNAVSTHRATMEKHSISQEAEISLNAPQLFNNITNINSSEPTGKPNKAPLLSSSN